MLEMSDTKVKFNYTLFEETLTARAVDVAERALKESLNIIADEAKKLTYSEIASNIEVSKIERKKYGKGVSLLGSVFVDLKKVPYARAVEKGSGMHERGNPHKIPIDAKNAPALVFFWEKANRMFVGQHVDHPGVEAKPYLSKSLKKNKQRILSTIKARLNGK